MVATATFTSINNRLKLPGQQHDDMRPHAADMDYQQQQPRRGSTPDSGQLPDVTEYLNDQKCLLLLRRGSTITTGCQDQPWNGYLGADAEEASTAQQQQLAMSQLLLSHLHHANKDQATSAVSSGCLSGQLTASHSLCQTLSPDSLRRWLSKFTTTSAHNHTQTQQQQKLATKSPGSGNDVTAWQQWQQQALAAAGQGDAGGSAAGSNRHSEDDSTAERGLEQVERSKQADDTAAVKQLIPEGVVDVSAAADAAAVAAAAVGINANTRSGYVGVSADCIPAVEAAQLQPSGAAISPSSPGSPSGDSDVFECAAALVSMATGSRQLSEVVVDTAAAAAAAAADQDKPGSSEVALPMAAAAAPSPNHTAVQAKAWQQQHKGPSRRFGRRRPPISPYKQQQLLQQTTHNPVAKLGTSAVGNNLAAAGGSASVCRPAGGVISPFAAVAHSADVQQQQQQQQEAKQSQSAAAAGLGGLALTSPFAALAHVEHGAEDEETSRRDLAATASQHSSSSGHSSKSMPAPPPHTPANNAQSTAAAAALAAGRRASAAALPMHHAAASLGVRRTGSSSLPPHPTTASTVTAAALKKRRSSSSSHSVRMQRSLSGTPDLGAAVSGGLGLLGSSGSSSRLFSTMKSMGLTVSPSGSGVDTRALLLAATGSVGCGVTEAHNTHEGVGEPGLKQQQQQQAVQASQAAATAAKPSTAMPTQMVRAASYDAAAAAVAGRQWLPSSLPTAALLAVAGPGAAAAAAAAAAVRSIGMTLAPNSGDVGSLLMPPPRSTTAAAVPARCGSMPAAVNGSKTLNTLTAQQQQAYLQGISPQALSLPARQQQQQLHRKQQHKLPHVHQDQINLHHQKRQRSNSISESDLLMRELRHLTSSDDLQQRATLEVMQQAAAIQRFYSMQGAEDLGEISAAAATGGNAAAAVAVAAAAAAAADASGEADEQHREAKRMRLQDVGGDGEQGPVTAATTCTAPEPLPATTEQAAAAERKDVSDAPAAAAVKGDPCVGADGVESVAAVAAASKSASPLKSSPTTTELPQHDASQTTAGAAAAAAAAAAAVHKLGKEPLQSAADAPVMSHPVTAAAGAATAAASTVATDADADDEDLNREPSSGSRPAAARAAAEGCPAKPSSSGALPSSSVSHSATPSKQRQQQHLIEGTADSPAPVKQQRKKQQQQQRPSKLSVMTSPDVRQPDDHHDDHQGTDLAAAAAAACPGSPSLTCASLIEGDTREGRRKHINRMKRSRSAHLSAGTAAAARAGAASSSRPQKMSRYGSTGLPTSPAAATATAASGRVAGTRSPAQPVVMRRSRSAFHNSALEQLAADAQRMLQQTDRELHMSRQLSGGYNAAAAVAAVGGGGSGQGVAAALTAGGYGRGIDILEGLHVVTPSGTPPPTQQQQHQPNLVQRVRSPLPGIPISTAAATAAAAAAAGGCPASEVLCGLSRAHTLPLFVGPPPGK